ncbi:efflux RND transporter permease subunit [Phascolarctobacterium faecium]|uniref:efflux RND transporter permease subunit n=1 Tax=Phascolarctobacterium faecium TaxID=33025 RepID=UPI002432EE3E|nr:efflux RND transporter permease subunit [Phascolarctobacterium faecium]
MIGTFIRRPVFTTMFVLLLVVFGIKSYPNLGVDLYPDVELPLVSVTVTYTGASPEEMETLITRPIEDRVSQVAGIKTLSSTVREGYSQTTLEFELGVDPREMASEVREKVASVRRRLPDDIDEPVVQRFDISSQSIAAFTFASDSRSREETRKIVEDVVKEELQRVEGVSEVSVVGASLRAIKLIADPEKLNSYNISFQTILDKVNSENINTPGGKARYNDMEITVRTLGKYKNIDDIKNIVIANQDGRPIQLSDVVKVVDSWEDEDTYSRSNKVPSVMVLVRKQSKTNTVDVVDGVNASMEQMMENDLPKDIKVDVVRDQSAYIRENVADVWNAILFGGFLALLITYMFLRDFRATIIGGLSIPTSVIATFFLMKSMDFTLNNMSLMALSLAVGILIDDAIVLIENIFRHMEMGKSPIQAAQDATEELSLAILATSLSLMAVFVPIGSMGEVVGQYFKQFGLTVAFALAFSTMAAYTLTPMISAYWLKDYREEHAKPYKHPRPKVVQICLDKFETGFQVICRMYDELMVFAFQHPWKIVLISVASLIFNLFLLPFIGTEYQPTYDSGEFSVSVKAPAGTSIERMKELTLPLEEEILQMPEVRIAAMRLGGSRVPINEGNIDVKLIPSSDRDRSMIDIMDELRRKFGNVEELKVAVVSNQGGGRGDSRPVQVGLRGSDLELLTTYAQNLAERIRQVPGSTDVDISSSEEEPEIIVKVDPLRASAMGLDSTSVGKVVEMAFLGKSTSNSFTIGDNDYDIIVQLDAAHRRDINDVANLRVSNTEGKFVRLGDVADVYFSSGPTRIDREDRQRQIVVYANTVGITPGDLIQKIQTEMIPDMNMQVGYRYKMIGQADTMAKAFSEIAKAVILAIIMIYMVLAAEFESFMQPLVIMMSLPFAIIGAVLGLMVAGQTANMMSLIGFTMLLGLVTKNAILLVDYANQARAKGMPLREALREACALRIRPIFMTTLSTILGMLPIALGLGAGAELRQSMGVVLVCGLTTSTLLTLVVVPLLYLLSEEWKEKHLHKS